MAGADDLSGVATAVRLSRRQRELRSRAATLAVLSQLPLGPRPEDHSR